MGKINMFEKIVRIIIVMFSIFAILLGTYGGIMVYIKANSIHLAVTTGLPLIAIGCVSLYYLKKMKGD